MRGGDGEGDERGRDVQVLEGAAHGVLAADGRDLELHLRLQRAQQRLEGLAPALGIALCALTRYLRVEPALLVAAARGHDLGHGLHHRQHRAAEGVRLGQDRVEAPAHQGAGRGLALEHGDLGGHGLGGGELVRAAKGHEHRARADGGVEPLGQALLGADVEVRGHGGELLLPGRAGEVVRGGLARGHGHARVLGRAVGVQELAAQGDDGGAVPVHGQARLGNDLGHDHGREVFPGGRGDELLRVLGRNDHGHALLGLGDGKLGAVQAVVLAGHGVEINAQAVRELADGHRYAARAEVVAAQDHARDLRVAEQALQLALLGRIALLHLRAAGGEGTPPCGTWRSRSRRRSRRGRSRRRAGSPRRRGAGARGGCWHRAPRPAPRRSPGAWRHSPRHRSPARSRWPGQSGCRRRSSRPRRWW